MAIDTISFKKTLVINAPIQDVFLFWSDFHNFPKFIWLIESVEILDQQRSRWIVKAPMDRKVKFDSVMSTKVENKSIVWESHHHAVDSRGNLLFSENQGTTTVELVFSYSIKVSWVHKLAKLMNRFGFPSLTFDEGLQRIKQEIETTYASSERSRLQASLEQGKPEY